MSENKKIKVALLWHMHQPYYFNHDTLKFQMPWVRLHGLKDYLDMPRMAAGFKNSKVTFNLVPSLLDQIELYCQGYTDRHQELSAIPARDLDVNQKKEIISSFFSVYYPRMIKPYVRYRQLYKKMESCSGDLDLAVKIFSSSEWLDLQVWSNLTWIDPMFRDEEPIAYLFKMEKNYTEQDKKYLLDYQLNILQRIIPEYRQLHNDGLIDISFSPYYHPILPLLIDSESAKESAPEIYLPQNHFKHPEDCDWQIENTKQKYQKIFGKKLAGIWPSEGSISSDTIKSFARHGVKWAASDQEVLYYSIVKSGLDPKKFSPYTAYIYKKAPETTLFFRDQGLSDKIGFVYSSWDHDRAAQDFVENIKGLRSILSRNSDDAVVPIILDGENTWEFYRNDGVDFLRQFYRALTEDKEIEMITLSEAAEQIRPTAIPELQAGSWINHNFKVWIGHPEDNAAWDLLYKTRETLVDFEKRNPDCDREKIDKAWRQIYIAEGSDWCWWYGDDHQGDYNFEFDRLFRAHLAHIYKIIDLDPPEELSLPIHVGTQDTILVYPESLVTPIIDGRQTHYYEWSGAGCMDCSAANKTMHRVHQIVKKIFFAYDYERFYIRLDFELKFELNKNSGNVLKIEFRNIGTKVIDCDVRKMGESEEFGFNFDQILEFEIKRKSILAEGFGRIEFYLEVCEAREMKERWPAEGFISIDIPEREKEIFWQV